MARKLKNVENETQTLFKLNWRETLKNGENEKCTLTWNMARNGV
ncbi:hypothetical protein T03_8776 [Trichinella britovi]|uniref:Uncharacterized protein n=1 Tax=Trichinella britovi TaxID=45882 RepID=A0A0V0Z343_TRIBR|nr:hypothetical protein T03_8776 [Trichinella britovi]